MFRTKVVCMYLVQSLLVAAPLLLPRSPLTIYTHDRGRLILEHPPHHITNKPTCVINYANKNLSPNLTTKSNNFMF